MINHEMLIIERLWAILEAYGPFIAYAKAPNRIKLHIPSTDGRTIIKSSWNDGDFPECTISVGGWTDTLWTVGSTYDNRRPGTSAAPTSNTDLAYRVLIELIHQNTDFTTASAADHQLWIPIRNAGPNLGFAAPTKLILGAGTTNRRIADGRTPEGFSDAGGTERLVSVHSLPVTVRTPMSTLLA